ncbi:MAG TPA: BamA/TamA family outer membrane protein [Nannocystaceae bacterium]|nr:BamA/TamA family outer membrane protein [Nannocystaceae bacterium]
MRSVLLALACFVLVLLRSSSASAGNPDLRWRTIETEHFYVHYFAGEEEAAERVAAVAEQAYAELTMAWSHRVFLKVHITLTDSQDTANGRATAVPFPQIIAYTTAPEALSVLEGYDDWFDILITHELTHVVHLDTVHGISRLANALLGFGVLGKVTSPNILQPRWMVEGIATMEESRLSSQGRLNNAMFEGFMRMAVLDRHFQTLDQVSSGARIYPHGSSVYLYGSHFMNYIQDRYGHDKLTELSHIYATQIVPFGINRAVQKVLGIDWQQLYKEFKEFVVEKYEAQSRRIKSRGLRQGRRMTFSGETTRYPAWSADDGWIYFYKADGHNEEGLKRIASSGGRIREGRGIGRQGVDVDVQHVIDIEDVAEATFVGATGDIVFDQVGVYDQRYRWNDLWRYNGGDPKDAEQLTFGLRASEPHVSYDGRTVVFRRNDIAQSRLAFLDMASGEVTELPPVSRIGQVYTPRFSPDAKRVAYSAWREGGYRDIYVYDRESDTTERITADRHMDLSPSWTPDGRHILFSSDRDGVFNIHAYDVATGEVRQVSNVLGGAFEPMPSHDGTRIAYLGYSWSGFDLWVMELDEHDWLPAMPATSALKAAEDPKPVLPGAQPLSAKSKRYQPIKTMYPRVLASGALETIASSAGSVIGVETGVSDVVGLHAIAGNFTYLTDERVAVGGVSYSLKRFFPNFSFSFNRSYSHRTANSTRYIYDRTPAQGDIYQVRGYRERNTRFAIDMDIPVLRQARHEANFSATYQFQRIRNLDANDEGIDPNAPAAARPEVGDFASLAMRVAYSNEFDAANRFAYGAERGRAASVTMTIFDKRLGGDYGDLQASFLYRESIPMPWRGHQSLVFTLRGGASAGGIARRGAFCVGDYTWGSDVFRDLVARTPTGSGGCSLLRGYPGPNNPQNKDIVAGRYFGIFSAAYRIPLVDVDRGISTLPVFFQRAGMIPFVDYGGAWSGPIRFKDLLAGAGAALFFTFRLGYAEGITLAVQYAHGFDDTLGVDSIRAVIAGSF